MIHRPPHTAFPVLFATQFSFAGCPVLAERQYPTLRAVDPSRKKEPGRSRCRARAGWRSQGAGRGRRVCRRRMTISESKTVTDCQDWLKPPLYPEFRKSRAPRPSVALLRGSLACKGGKLNLGARKFCGEGQRVQPHSICRYRSLSCRRGECDGAVGVDVLTGVRPVG